MDKNLHNIDRIFLQKIEEHIGEPDDQIWQNIDKELHPQNDRRPGAAWKRKPWLWALLPVAAALYFAYHSFNPKTMEVQQSQSVDNIRNTESFSSTDSYTQTKVDAQESAANTVTKNQLSDNSSKAQKSALEKNKVKQGVAKQEPDAQRSKDLLKHSTKQPISRKSGNIVVQKPSNANTAANYVRRDRNIQHKPKAEIKIKPAPQNEPVDEFAELNSSIDKPFLAPANLKPLMQPTSFMELIALDKVEINNLKPNTITVSINKKTENTITNEIPFSISLYGGPEWVQRKVSMGNGRHDHLEDDHHHIESTERISSAYKLGMDMQVALHKQLFLKTGFAYSTMSSITQPGKVFLRYRENRHIGGGGGGTPTGGDSTLMYKINTVSGYSWLNPNTVTNIQFGDSAVATSVSSKLSYIEVPLQVGYRLKAGKWYIDLLGGLNFHITTTKRIDATIRTPIGEDRSGRLKMEGVKPLYTSMHAATAISYPIYNEWRLFVRPSIQLPMGTVNRYTPAATRQQKTGLVLGVQWEL